MSVLQRRNQGQKRQARHAAGHCVPHLLPAPRSPSDSTSGAAQFPSLPGGRSAWRQQLRHRPGRRHGAIGAAQEDEAAGQAVQCTGVSAMPYVFRLEPALPPHVSRRRGVMLTSLHLQHPPFHIASYVHANWQPQMGHPLAPSPGVSGRRPLAPGAESPGACSSVSAVARPRPGCMASPHNPVYVSRPMHGSVPASSAVSGAMAGQMATRSSGI